MDYTSLIKEVDIPELVKALRCGNDGKLPCDNKECPYWVDQWHGIGLCNILKKQSDAAAAIEALQAQLPKRGEWIVREVDIPGEIHPVAFRCMCSMCRNEYVFPRIPQYCPDCGSMNTAKMEVQDGK